MSLYLRHPDAAPVRIEVYPKRRQQPTITFGSSERQQRHDDVAEPCYADFLREPMESSSVA